MAAFGGKAGRYAYLVAVRYFGLGHNQTSIAITIHGMVLCEDGGPFRSSKTNGRQRAAVFFAREFILEQGTQQSCQIKRRRLEKLWPSIELSMSLSLRLRR